MTSHALTWADWFCKYKSPVELIQNNPYFFAAELVFGFLCMLTFAHAYRHGGRYLYTWIAVTVHAFVIETLAISVPELNLYWHAQGMLSFFGMRVPLYALFGFHQMFLYTSYVLVSRMFWTPWSSLYFYAACACSFVWMLRLTRRLLLEKEYDWMKFPKELTCSFLTGVLSYWLGTAHVTRDITFNAVDSRNNRQYSFIFERSLTEW
ncbi:unnamed protein product [Cylicocyclus nassatus]|uniref:DUF7802 domain-containing protein n=1 Tax=Cylicocyclus nassatus TaxID=53992 RepID=A0AA36H8B8_CYLNA|nr:unnamed protein product [Cylicocyclus nassatus]